MNDRRDQSIAIVIGGSPFSLELPNTERPIELVDCNKILVRTLNLSRAKRPTELFLGRWGHGR
jgi:hypothetical protein